MSCYLPQFLWIKTDRNNQNLARHHIDPLYSPAIYTYLGVPDQPEYPTPPLSFLQLVEQNDFDFIDFKQSLYL